MEERRRTTPLTDAMPVQNEGERHIAAVLLVDVSGSMDGKPIDELNQGLIEFGKALKKDNLARGRADVCVISFNHEVHTEVGFRPATQYEAPVLKAGGLTSMNEAIIAGLDAIDARKTEYRNSGISWYRPWLFVLTDGYPTDEDMEGEAKAKLQDAISGNHVVYIPMGIGPDADIAHLQSYYPADAEKRTVLKATADNFQNAFEWLSNSIVEVAKADPNTTDQVNLPNTPSNIAVGI